MPIHVLTTRTALAASVGRKPAASAVPLTSSLAYRRTFVGLAQQRVSPVGQFRVPAAVFG